MKSIFLGLALSLFSLLASAQSSVVIDVTLNPMGSFKAKTSEVKGNAVLAADGSVSASHIVVDTTSLKTGVELRDKHTKKHLLTDKFPTAELLSATGKGGKGTGRIKIKGIEKDIQGTYKVDGKLLKADFDLNINDFDIKDVVYMGVGVEEKITLHVVVPIASK